MSLSSASFRSNNFTDASGILTYTSLVGTVLLNGAVSISLVDFRSISLEAFVKGVYISAIYSGNSLPFLVLSCTHHFMYQEFDLSSGESFEVKFVGKRVAFR